MNTEELKNKAEKLMQDTLDYVQHEFSSVRTGKASPALVENINIKVQSYGSSMSLKQLALITTPEPRQILIQPFDPATSADIEKGIRESSLGINPSLEGKSIRLPIPELSEERRKDLVKMIKQMAESGRVKIRQHRRDHIDTIKKMQKNSEITEDILHDLETEIQKTTDKFISQISELVDNKEEEIMKV